MRYLDVVIKHRDPTNLLDMILKSLKKLKEDSWSSVPTHLGQWICQQKITQVDSYHVLYTVLMRM